MKKCPSCAEEIQDEAIKCRFCGNVMPEENKRVENISNKGWGKIGIGILIFIIGSPLFGFLLGPYGLFGNFIAGIIGGPFIIDGIGLILNPHSEAAKQADIKFKIVKTTAPSVVRIPIRLKPITIGRGLKVAIVALCVGAVIFIGLFMIVTKINSP